VSSENNIHAIDFRDAKLLCGCIPGPIPFDLGDGLGVHCVKCGHSCGSRVHHINAAQERRQGQVDLIVEAMKRAAA
jgi:hypothetical protein